MIILHFNNMLHVHSEEKMNKHFDMGSLVIIAITCILFTIALFTKGFTHDLLLEAGVLLVSAKLIVMAYKHSVASKEIAEGLHAIKEMLERGEK